MFDIAFSELVLIGVVALIVIGPERLPRVARTAGHLFGRFQRYVADVKADIGRELQAEDLRKLQEEVRSSVQALEQSVREGAEQAGQEFKGVAEQVHEIVEIPRQAAAEHSIAAPPAAEPVAAAEEETKPHPGTAAEEGAQPQPGTASPSTPPSSRNA